MMILGPNKNVMLLLKSRVLAAMLCHWMHHHPRGLQYLGL